MKVCFFGLSLAYKGGVENLSINLIKHLAHNKQIDEVLVICDEINDETQKSLPSKKVNVECLGRVKKSDFVRILIRNFKYGSLLKKLAKFDVFHVLDCRAYSLITKTLHPLIINIHDVMVYELASELRAMSFLSTDLIHKIDHHLPQLFMEFLSVSKTDRILVNTPIVAARLRKVYGKKIDGKIRVIPPGFDSYRFNPYFTTKTKAKSYLNLDPKTKVILHVGGAAPRKGLTYLLKAIESMYLRGELDKTRISLLVLGKLNKSQKASFKTIQNHIIELQQVSEEMLPIVYRAADVFIMPSISEGWGISLIQALACGTPVIASRNVPSALDALDTGMVLIEPSIDNPTKFAESILRFLRNTDSLNIQWESIFNLLVSRYSWENVSQSVFEIYQEFM